MKQELPIAVTLLAAGGLLWCAHAIPWDPPTANVPESTIQIETARPTEPVIRDRFVETASYQQPLEPPAAALPPADSDRLLRGTAASLVTAGFKTQFQCEANWSNQAIEVQGQYLQQGQGTGRFRVDLTSVNPPGEILISRISDGRFLYTRRIVGGEQKLDFIDLQQTSKTMRGTETPGKFNPMNWDSREGLSGLFGNLADSFSFSQPQLVNFPNDNGVEVQGCFCEGTWRKGVLQDLIRHIDGQPLDTSAPIPMDRMPPQLPTHVVVLFRTDPATGSWTPHAIELIRSIHWNRGDEERTFMQIQFANFEPITAEDLDRFEIHSGESNATDATERYTEQIYNFDYQRRAQLQSESQSTTR